MKDYGTQRSTVEPLELEITDSKVFVASNIAEISEDGTDEEPGFSGYEFDLIEYEKDEYIKLQAEKNAELEEELTETQVALCDVYEMLI